ncbi:MAG: Na+/H+ antiporter subunit D [Alphaproteobacteria bacterium]|nr:Na+/H+ antiporter subunit D [Alphaproteobacteria bacterium]
MSDMAAWLLVWPVAIPLIGSALAIALWGRPNAQSAIGLIAITLQLVASLALLGHVWTNGPIAMSMGGWPAPFGIALAADTLGAGLTVAASAVALAILVYGLADTNIEQRRAGIIPLLLALMMGVAGAFLTADIFNLYVWFEVTLISSFGLMVLGGRREQLDGAVKYAFLNLLATTLLLIAIALLYGMTGTLSMADLSGKVANLPDDAPVETIALLFLVSLGMKSALFPLHFWLPAAYHTPLPTVSAIFAALLTKVGVYSLLRVFMIVFPDGGEIAREAMVWIAVATMIVGALGALAEADIRRVISYTVMSGVGVMVGGLAIGTELALIGTTFYIIHSIIVSAALFMAAGMVARAGGGTRIGDLAGLYKGAPFIAVAFLISGLSLAGVPPLAGFWPKVYLVQAGLQAGEYAIVAGVLASGFLTLILVGRIFALVFWREATDGARVTAADTASTSSANDSTLLKSALGALAALTFVIGVYSVPVVDMSSRAAAELLAPEAYIEAVFQSPAQTAAADTDSAEAPR